MQHSVNLVIYYIPGFGLKEFNMKSETLQFSLGLLVMEPSPSKLNICSFTVC